MMFTILQDSCQVKSLNIGNNNFGDKVGGAIADVIASNDTLQIMKASWNSIRNKGSIAIANAIKVVFNIIISHILIILNKNINILNCEYCVYARIYKILAHYNFISLHFSVNYYLHIYYRYVYL